MRMPEKIDDYFFAPCGVNCFVCYVHLKVKKPCNGCYGSDDNKPERCKNCTIKQCVSNKSLQYCFECNDYPCQLIKNLEKSYTKRYNVSIMANSEMVKKYGVLLHNTECIALSVNNSKYFLSCFTNTNAEIITIFINHN